MALGDYGSDVSAIDNRTFDRILLASPNVNVKNLDDSVRLLTAFDDETTKSYSATRSVILSIVIHLPGSNIPVRIRGVEFLVVDQQMDETLLGRPFLNRIGFNLEDHLKHVRHAINNKHISDINPREVKIASAKYQGLTYMAIDDDPIELPDCISAGIGVDTEESISNAFSLILEKAKSNGITQKGLEKLSALLKEHQNSFRIKLGKDPPADVPPLVVTPFANAKPYRAPQRRYAPQHCDFINRTIKELEAVGAIYKNPSSLWASPALAVPKPGSNKLRFTVDLR